jgi:hypothetical protein
MAQKPQGVADAMIEAEMWNHSSAPFHGGVTGALYRVSGVGQLSAAERYTPRRLASQPSAAHQYIDEQDNQEDREDARGRIAIRMRLLLDSRVVDLPRSSNLIVVTPPSLKPLFFNDLKKVLPFLEHGGA